MTEQMRRITHTDWLEEGKRRFGKDMYDWKFVCPVCGHVASIRDWKQAGATEGEVAFSCIGRRIEGSKQAFDEKGAGPCTYAGGGLIKLNPVHVVMPDFSTRQCFEFAPEEAT